MNFRFTTRAIALSVALAAVCAAAPNQSHVPAAVQNGTARFVSHQDPNQMMRFVIALQPPHPTEEAQFLEKVQTKGDPLFHHFLTADQWAKRFAPSVADEQAVVDWAHDAGFNVTQRYPNRLIVSLEATSGRVETAFGVKLNQYQLGTRTFFSNDREPFLPSHLANVIQNVLGLNTADVMHPHFKGAEKMEWSAAPYKPGPMVAKGSTVKLDGNKAKLAAAAKSKKATSAAKGVLLPQFTNGFMDPSDIYNSNEYDYQALFNQGHCCNPYGANTAPPEASIGIATAYSYVGSDLLGFAGQYNLALNVTPYNIGGTPSCPSSNPSCNLETTLDAEWSSATANSYGSWHDTAAIFVYQGIDSTPGTFTSIYNQMLSDNQVRVVNISWGCGEQNGCAPSSDMDTQNNIFSEMAGRGWTVVAAAGDNGATPYSYTDSNGNPVCQTTLGVNFPASSPYVVAAGGTTLSMYTDDTYISETAWVGGTYTGACAGNNGGGGGGYSGYYGEPGYQSFLGAGNRAVPDLSLNASSGQNFYYNGSLSSVGGTSIVSPELSGFFAQDNAYLLAIGNQCYGNACAPMGDPHYALYYTGRGFGPINPFYDITSGCNSNDVTAANNLNAYCAGSGYDEATGWGSANMLQLAWALNWYYGDDTQAPAVAYSGPDTSFWYNTDQNVSWSISDVGTYPINIAGFSQAWDYDPGNVTSEATPGSGNSFYSGPEFPNGSTGYLAVSWAGQGCHTAHVRAWDNAGNSSDNTYGGVCYDTIAPESYVTISPSPNGNGWTNKTTTVTLDLYDPGYSTGTGSGPYALGYAINNAACNSSNTSQCVYYYPGHQVSFGQGVNTLYYYGIDNANNTDAQHAQVVKVDVNAPSTTAALAGTKPSTYYTSPVKVTLTGKDDLSGVASITYSVDGGSALTYGAPFTVTAAGSHAVQFHSTDRASNVEKTESVSFVIHGVTAAALQSSANPVAPNTNVTFTASITSADGVPTGSVIFKNGSTTLGTAALASGKASFTTHTLSAGTHTITAQYEGSTNYAVSNIASLSQKVDETSTVTLTTSVATAVYGFDVSFTATVKSPGNTPAGTVTFKDGSTTLGSATLSGGATHLNVTKLSVGTHHITATYTGDSTDLGSTSPALTETIVAVSTRSALTSSINPSLYTQPITLEAFITSNTGVTPTGSVQFFHGTTLLGTVGLSNSRANLVVTTLPGGSDSLTVNYLGNTDFVKSTSPAYIQVVRNNTHTFVASSLNPSKAGQAVKFSIAVQSTSTPTGTVTLKNGSTVLATLTLVNGGASYTTSALAKGSHAITATYNGVTYFAPSTSTTLTQVVQ